VDVFHKPTHVGPTEIERVSAAAMLEPARRPREIHSGGEQSQRGVVRDGTRKRAAQGSTR
jgi:hypothetical protein